MVVPISAEQGHEVSQASYTYSKGIYVHNSESCYAFVVRYSMH